MNKALQDLHHICQRSTSILLTGPVYPDGDSIGACIALRRGIKQFSDARVDIAAKASFRYAWMPDVEQFTPEEEIDREYDLAIVLDGDRHRLHHVVENAYNRSSTQAIIDHHASTNPHDYSLALIDAEAESTCGMLFDILMKWGVSIDTCMAQSLYTGVIFDTAGFRHSNTKPSTHRLAAQLIEMGIDHSQISAKILMERKPSGLRLLCFVLQHLTYLADGRISFCIISFSDMQSLNCTVGDYEGIVEMMLFTQGVQVAGLCIERSPGQFKVSLRSRIFVNVAKLAQSMSESGGGHPKASGVILTGNLADISELIQTTLKNSLQ